MMFEGGYDLQKLYKEVHAERAKPKGHLDDSVYAKRSYEHRHTVKLNEVCWIPLNQTLIRRKRTDMSGQEFVFDAEVFGYFACDWSATEDRCNHHIVFYVTPNRKLIIHHGRVKFVNDKLMSNTIEVVDINELFAAAYMGTLEDYVDDYALNRYSRPMRNAILPFIEQLVGSNTTVISSSPIVID